MRIGRIAALYAVIVGIAMLGMWTVFVATGQVPELSSEPIRVSMHIIGEVATALVLLIGGYGLWTEKNWGPMAFMLSMGMLLYTLIVSPGYYAQGGNAAMVGMFAVLLIIAVALAGLGFLRPAEYMPGVKK